MMGSRQLQQCAAGWEAQTKGTQVLALDKCMGRVGLFFSSGFWWCAFQCSLPCARFSYLHCHVLMACGIPVYKSFLLTSYFKPKWLSREGSLLLLWRTCFDSQSLIGQLTILTPIPRDLLPSAGLYNHVPLHGPFTGVQEHTCLHNKNKSIIFRKEIINQRMTLIITICYHLGSNLLI